MELLIYQMQKVFEIGCMLCEALELWSFGALELWSGVSQLCGGGSLWCLEYGVVPTQLCS